jgi:hypothetical protein
VSVLPIIGAAPLGRCHACGVTLFETTRGCVRPSFGMRRAPRRQEDPPCPAEDGTLEKLKAAKKGA